MNDWVVWLIIAVGVFTAAVWGYTFWLARKLKTSMRIVVRKANFKKVEGSEFEDKYLHWQDRMNMGYAMFANLTASFPLLGMLGTVKSLLGLAGNMSQSDIAVDQFFSALNTTLAGLIGAIICKAILDSILSPLVAYNNNEMNTYQARNTEVMQEQKSAAEGETE